MDMRRLRVGEWILAVSGVATIASLWLPWWRLPDSAGPAADPTGWQVLSAIDVLVALLGLLALVSVAVVASARATGPGLAAEVLLTPYAIATAVVVGIRLLDVPAELEAPPGIAGATSLAVGAWLCLAGCAGVLVGALVGMRDERLSRPGQPTDQTGVPVSEPRRVETLSPPPRA